MQFLLVLLGRHREMMQPNRFYFVLRFRHHLIPEHFEAGCEVAQVQRILDGVVFEVIGTQRPVDHRNQKGMSFGDGDQWRCRIPE